MLYSSLASSCNTGTHVSAPTAPNAIAVDNRALLNTTALYDTSLALPRIAPALHPMPSNSMLPVIVPISRPYPLQHTTLLHTDSLLHPQYALPPLVHASQFPVHLYSSPFPGSPANRTFPHCPSLSFQSFTSPSAPSSHHRSPLSAPSPHPAHSYYFVPYNQEHSNQTS